MRRVSERFSVVASSAAAALVLGAAALFARPPVSPPRAEPGRAAGPAEGHPGDRGVKPNIIVILADDLGYSDVSSYEGGRFATPNIDRIGRSGVRFTDGYATAPVCAPSRAGLMTGRYQERFGFEYNGGPAQRDATQGLGLAVGEATLADLLKADGYHTGLIGKWHLGSQEQFYPTHRGFDEFVGFLPGETSYIDPSEPGVHVAYGPLGDEASKRSATARSADPDADLGGGRRAKRIADTFRRGRLNQIVEGGDRRIVHNEKEYLTDYFGGRAVDFIRRRSASGEPYFLYLAFNAPHSPHMATAKYYDRFAYIKDHQLRVYAAMIAALDDAVGGVLDAVDASGAASRTLIVFASDNGCAAYWPGLCPCAPLRGGKLSYYEGGIRVPFLMRWPGHIPAGLVYREPVSLLDVLPTSVAAAGAALPKDRTYDGVNLLPYLTGEKRNAPHDMLAWRRLPLYAIRQGDWKLWESANDRSGQYGDYKLLFDLGKDLDETTDLSDRYPQKVTELESSLHEWAKMMADPAWPSRPPPRFDVCGRTFRLPI